MFHISKQKVGGITFVRLHVMGRHYVFSMCKTNKRGVIAA